MPPRGEDGVAAIDFDLFVARLVKSTPLLVARRLEIAEAFQPQLCRTYDTVAVSHSGQRGSTSPVKLYPQLGQYPSARRAARRYGPRMKAMMGPPHTT